MHRAVGEESEAPAQSQDTAQAHDGQSVRGSRLFVWNGDGGAFTSDQEEPAEHHYEGEEGDEEDDGVVTNVHYIVHGWVGDPAPARTKTFISWELSVQQFLCGHYREMQK